MTVFVVQQQMKFDKEIGALVPRFSGLDKAERFGPLKYVLPPHAHAFDPEAVIGDMHSSLLDFCDDDFLLLVGNPALIGMVTAVAAHYNDGSVRLLQWSGRHEEYTEITAKIF